MKYRFLSAVLCTVMIFNIAFEASAQSMFSEKSKSRQNMAGRTTSYSREPELRGDAYYEQRIAELKNELAQKERRLEATAVSNEKGLKNFGANFFANYENALLPLPDTAAPENYVLSKGDDLTFFAWSDMGDVTYEETRVNGEGQAYLPMFGVVPVAGKTIKAVEANLRAMLGDRAKNLKFSLAVKSIKPVQVFVAGEVNNPGSIVVSGLTTAFSVLYSAGGPNSNGSLRNIMLVTSSGEVKKIDFYKYFLNGDKSQDLPIKSGDTLFVPATSKKVSIAGSVLRPAIYEIYDGMTLSKALEMAGGLQPGARVSRVSIKRWSQDERRKTFDVDTSNLSTMSTFKVLPGDEIEAYMGSQKLTNSLLITGPVALPGYYSFAEGMTVKDLVAKAGGVLAHEVSYKTGKIVRQLEGGKEQIINFDLGAALSGDAHSDRALKELDQVILFEEKDIEYSEDVVRIGGGVVEPGKYRYFKGMRLSDLISLAKGLKPEAFGEAEISFVGSDGRMKIIRTDAKAAISKPAGENDIALGANYHVNIVVNYVASRKPDLVTVKGALRKNGVFAVDTSKDTLWDLIERAGGFAKNAYPQGLMLFRKKESLGNAIQLKIINDSFGLLAEQLNAQPVINEEDKDSNSFSEALAKAEKENREKTQEMKAVQRDESLLLGFSKSDMTNISVPEFGKNIEKSPNPFLPLETEVKEESSKDPEFVRIVLFTASLKMKELEKLLKDVKMYDGDRLYIPEVPTTVTVVGQVMQPSIQAYKARRTPGYYIRSSGGYNPFADRRRTFIVKVDGNIKRQGEVKYIEPGDVVVIPARIDTPKKYTLKDYSSLASIIGSLAMTYKVINDN